LRDCGHPAPPRLPILRESLTDGQDPVRPIRLGCWRQLSRRFMLVRCRRIPRLTTGWILLL